MILINVNNRELVIRQNERITSGSVGIKCKFNFSAEWSGLGKTAVFKGGSVTKDVVIGADNTVKIPHECMTTADTILRVGVYGSNSAGTIVIPTVYSEIALKVREGADPSGSTEGAVTPTVASQLTAIVEANTTKVNTIYSAYESGSLKGAKGDTGNGIASITETVSTADGGNNELKIKFTDGTEKTFTVKNGSKGSPGNDGKTPVKNVDYFDGQNGVGIASITETTSSVSGGENVVKITLTDGTVKTFTVLNGTKGDKGEAPEKGVDYFTEAEISEIEDDVKDKVSTEITAMLPSKIDEKIAEKNLVKTVNSTEADENGNVDVTDIFVVTYGATPFADIVQAHSDGKICVIKYNWRIYTLVTTGNNQLTFNAIDTAKMYYIYVTSSGTWGNGYDQLERGTNKVNSIIGRESSASYFPSTGAVADYFPTGVRNALGASAESGVIYDDSAKVNACKRIGASPSAWKWTQTYTLDEDKTSFGINLGAVAEEEIVVVFQNNNSVGGNNYFNSYAGTTKLSTGITPYFDSSYKTTVCRFKKITDTIIDYVSDASTNGYNHATKMGQILGNINQITNFVILTNGSTSKLGSGTTITVCVK